MEFKHLFPLMVIVSLILGSSACVRPASKSPLTTPTTSESFFPLPGTQEDVMSQLESFATQTAIAMLGLGTVQATPIAPIDMSPVEASTEVTSTIETTLEVQGTPIPKVEIPKATAGIPKTYTLEKGEHPYCIARRFDVNPEEMLRLSGLSGGSTFYAGTVLKIPQSGKPFPGKRSLKNHPTTYTVSSGDTIYTIACEFGDVSPDMIALANNLKHPYKLTAGQKIQIP